MNIGNKLKTYLIGAMENPKSKDGGVMWRESITPELKRRGIFVFDPTREELSKVGMPTEELHAKLQGWELAGHWHLFLEYMGLIWKGKSELKKDEETGKSQLVHMLGDVDYVEKSDFLIWYYEEGDKLGGTIAELVIAWYRGTPVYLVTSAPKSSFNKSLLYFVLDSGNGGGRIFPNFSQLTSFLDDKYNLKPQKDDKKK